LVGGIGFAVQLGALAFFRSVLQMNYLLATALAVETAVIHNFLWHQRFTWSDRPAASPLHFSSARRCIPERSGVSKARPAQSKDPYVLPSSLARLIKFNATNGAVSLAGNLLIMRALVGQWHMDYAIANLIAVATCSLINFLLSDRLVFQRAAKSYPSLTS
jgi:putative flippase GtrA